jgi:predicted enzyme related to lactoylglutathione lyase
MNPVNWFEIPVSSMDKARHFYESALGVQLSVTEVGLRKVAWFPMTLGAMGSTGTLVCGDGYTPSRAGTLVYFGVADIEAALGRVNANGGRTLMPKTSIGEHGFIAHFEDCEGNRVALHSRS